MVAYTLVQRLNANIALLIAGVAGVLIALATLAIPLGLLEDIVWRSGIAAFVASAEPPLGMTARITIGVVAGAGVSLFFWFALSAVIGWRDLRQGKQVARGPTVRRADAHPDAPPREPLRARDLDYPGMADNDDDEGVLELVPAELPELEPEPVIARGQPAPVIASPPSVQPLPDDLDQPLAAFDPGAIPEAPMVPPPPVAPLRRQARPAVFDPGERFETFELTPQLRPAPAPPVQAEREASPITAPETAASIHALLDRLERGVARRGEREPAEVTPPPEPTPPPPAPHGLEDTLEMLRKLAIRA